jgi:hypothetical protein
MKIKGFYGDIYSHITINYVLTWYGEWEKNVC